MAYMQEVNGSVYKQTPDNRIEGTLSTVRDFVMVKDLHIVVATA